MSLHLFLAGLHAVGLIALCTIAYGWIQRHVPHRCLRHMLIGGLLGLGSALSMLQPFIVVDGMQVDGRNTFLAMATAFGGAYATVIAVIIAGIARTAIGGAGVTVGLATMLLACIMAALWAYVTHSPNKRSWWAWITLGLILSAPLLVLMVILDVAEPYVAATRLVTDMTGALVFGKMFESEYRRGRRERQLNLEASTDPLTGLPNRRALMDYVDHLAPDTRDHMALLIIDADHFKSINDRHGHSVGDEVLKLIADSLTASIRETDFAARFGGEEFAVLLNVDSPENGYELADRLRKALSLQTAVDGKKLMVTVSVGGVRLPAKDFTFQDVYARADAALYEAKRLGRDRAVFA